MTRKVTVEFLGEDKSLGKTMNDVDGKSSKLAGTLGKVGKAAALGLAAGAVAGAAGLVKLTQGAMEDDAAQQRLALTLKNTTGATDKQVAGVEKWISAQGKALGVTDDELRPALEKLATATGDVGEAQKLTSLAMDVSAGTGKSLEQVSTAIMKAQNGQIAGLSRLGVETTNAAGETLTFEQATAKMAETFGGQAATKAETLQGKMDRLKLILSETGETIGSKMIPMVTSMADWFLNKGLPALQVFGGWLGDVFPPIWEKIRTVIQSVMGGVNGDVGGALSSVQSIFQSVTSIVTTLWNTFGATIIEYARSAFENVKTIIGGALTVIQGIFQTFSALLQGDWNGVWEGVKTILRGAWQIIQGIVAQALNVLETAFDLGWTALKNIVDAAWEGVKTLTTNAIGKIIGWASEIPGKIQGALSNLVETARNVFGNAWDAAKTKTENIGDSIVTWVGGIPGKIRNGLSDLTETVRSIFDSAMAAGKEKVTNIGADIVGWIDGIPGKLRDKIGDFKSAGADLIGAVVDGMKNAAGIIEGIASNVWSAIKGLLNGAIDRINAALSFTISLPGPDLSVDVGNIPHLAKGTNNWRGGLAVVGEEGPELVNLPRGAKVTPHGESMGALRGMAGGGDGAPIVVQLVLPGGKVIEQLLIKHTRDSGRPLQVRTLGPA